MLDYFHGSDAQQSVMTDSFSATAQGTVPTNVPQVWSAFFQPFCGNERNWIFRNLEFREKILEFSKKILEFREKILEFSRKNLELREKLFILGNKFGI